MMIKDKKFFILISFAIIVITMEILSLINIKIPNPYAPIFYSFFILFIGHKVLYKGVIAIFKLKFSSINLLMTISVIGAFYLNQFPEASVVIILFVLGEYLEEVGINNSKTAINKLISNSPKLAFVKSKNIYLPVDSLKIGTIICVKPGEMIPLDGKIIYGETNIDEASITGEPIAKYKNIGDYTFAGTLNKEGYIEIISTKLYNDTNLSKIIRITFESSSNKGNTQKFINKFSLYYTPSIIFISMLIFFVQIYFFNFEINNSLNQALSLLVIACPCALVISTPIAIYSAIGNASRKGALIKGGKYLEALANIKAIALDKTRTLTKGSPIISDIVSLKKKSNKELLECIAGTEKYSEHPIAKEIVNYCLKKEYIPHNSINFKSKTGRGIESECLVCNNKIFIGNYEFIKENHIINKEEKKIIEDLSKEGKTIVILGNENHIDGIIALTDEIKHNTLEIINILKTLKIDLFLLTGDNENTANYVAKIIGIKNVYSDLLPEEKSNKISELLDKYKMVAMVGDGINDAPALAKSTVGISMGFTGSETAIETSNITLMNDNLSLLPYLILLSKKTLRRIKINTIGAVVVKLIFIFLALIGYSNLVFAIVADVGVTLIVILTSLNLMTFNEYKTSLGKHL